MQDTIVALATPPGISGIAVIRISGDDAITIADKHFIGKIKLNESKSHRIHYGKFVDEDKIIDTVTTSVFLAPNSYTGENVIEISTHGSVIIYNQIILSLIKSGARLAEPGEFTKRAFLNGKLDLLQAEAVADLINSISTISEHTSLRQLEGGFTQRIMSFRKELIEIAGLLELELDFADEDIEFITKPMLETKLINILNYVQDIIDSYKASNVLRTGFYVAIVGYPNTGKSTLFNTLLKRKRAIVSEIPGTTRDYIEEFIYINDIPIKIIDTAGMRESTDIIEIEGIKLVSSIIKQSNLIVVLNDAKISLNHSDNILKELKKQYPTHDIILVHNKIDAIDKTISNNQEISISAKYNKGIDDLKNEIYNKAKKYYIQENDIVVNQRQYNLLQEIKVNLNDALNSLKNDMENEFIAIDIRKAIKVIGELTGEIYNEDILNSIFSSFCIGK
jgi:tRNA modification GTPase